MKRSERWLALVLIALTAANLLLTLDTVLTRTAYRNLIRQQAQTSQDNGRKLDELLRHHP